MTSLPSPLTSSSFPSEHTDGSNLMIRFEADLANSRIICHRKLPNGTPVPDVFYERGKHPQFSSLSTHEFRNFQTCQRQLCWITSKNTR